MIPGRTPRGGRKETETRKGECNQIAKQTDGTSHFKGDTGELDPPGTSGEKKQRERKLLKCPRASAALLKSKAFITR